ncbi:Protein hira [Clonorchis sinensis]|uniref:Protein HIRA n=1 Tax=Clonorchis sinensis TaxID=79923 RepID=A0A3R7CHM8_CLOSI|nr:Protein hira [Clonorchis sinensis]
MRLLKPAWVSHGSLSKDQNTGLPIYSLDIHPDGSRLATSGLIDTCGVVILWNMAPIRDPKLEADPNTPRKLFQMDSHQACVNCVRWSPSGCWLASAGMDKVVMLWTKTSAASRQTTVFGLKEKTKFTEHWRCASVLRGHTGDILDLAWSHDGYKLASAGVDNNILVWCRQSTSGAPGSGPFVMLATLHGNQGFIKGVAWDPIGRYLVSQGDEISVKVWRTADWGEEAVIRKPFVKAVGQSQVMRISWSLDGSTIAAPHAINNGFPTTKLIDRNNWVPAFDLVGHRKHVICARYSPNLFRKSGKSETQDLVCLALGSKDRSVSVWTTADRRALVVIHDLFTNSVCDLTWSSTGSELMACSLDGTVSYMGFTEAELGTPWPTADLVRLHHKSYGQSLLDKLVAGELAELSHNLPISVSTGGKSLSGGLDQSNIILETPEALALQQTHAAVRQRLNEVGEQNILTSKPVALGPSKQIETRSKDGRRRIIPKFLGHLDNVDEEPNSRAQFASTLSQQSKSSVNSDEANSNGPTTVASPDVSKEGRKTPQTKSADFPEPQSHPPNRPVEAVRLGSVTSRSPIRREDTELQKPSDLSGLVSKTSPPPSSPRVVTIAVNGPSTPSDNLTSPEPVNQRKRAFTDVDTEVPVTTEDARENEPRSRSQPVGKQRKRRRVRLFEDAEEVPTAGGNDKKSTTQSKTADASSVTASPKSRDKTEIHSGLTQSSALESRLAGSTQPSPSSSIHSIITTPDQLANECKVQFVCSHPIDGPLLIELIGKTGAAATRPQESPGIFRITGSRNERQLWEIANDCRLTAYAYSDNLISFGDSSGRLQLLYGTGGRVCPPLLLDSSIHHLSLTPLGDGDGAKQPGCQSRVTPSGDSNPQLSRLHSVVSGTDIRVPARKLSPSSSSGYRLTALCQSGRLISWYLCLPPDIATLNSLLCSSPVFPQLLVETNVREVVRGPPSSSTGYLSLTFGTGGFPVVHRRDGSSYYFHTDSRTWLELFDASNKTRCAAALSTYRGCPSGPLASCQLLHKVIGPRSDSHKTDDLRSDTVQNQRLTVRRFLEAQTHNAMLFGSSAEYRFWFIRWFRQLIEDDQEDQIRHVCQDLIGPVFGNSRTSWQSTVKGISKHELVMELLTLFALNLRLQRLYVELKEMLEQCRTNASMLS